MPKYQDKERAPKYSPAYQAWAAAVKKDDVNARIKAAAAHDRQFSLKNRVVNGVKLGPIHD